MRYPLSLSCREASRLITARLDRPLTPVEWVALRLHLRICSACPRVIRQLDEIRRSLRDIRDATE